MLTHRQKNKALAKARNKRYIDQYKALHTCSVCGEGRVICLDLHHIDPMTKVFGFSDGTSRSIHTLDVELDKCVVLCANCHRLEHAGQRLEGIRLEEEQEKTLFSEQDGA